MFLTTLKSLSLTLSVLQVRKHSPVEHMLGLLCLIPPMKGPTPPLPPPPRLLLLLLLPQTTNHQTGSGDQTLGALPLKINSPLVLLRTKQQLEYFLPPSTGGSIAQWRCPRILVMWPAPILPASPVLPVNRRAQDPSGVGAARSATPGMDSYVKVMMSTLILQYDADLWRQTTTFRTAQLRHFSFG